MAMTVDVYSYVSVEFPFKSHTIVIGWMPCLRSMSADTDPPNELGTISPSDATRAMAAVPCLTVFITLFSFMPYVLSSEEGPLAVSRETAMFFDFVARFPPYRLLPGSVDHVVATRGGRPRCPGFGAAVR